MNKKLSALEKQEVKGLVKKIAVAANALLRNGGLVSLYYLRPPSSKKVETEVIKHFKKTLDIRWISEGISIRKTAVPV